MMAEKPILFSGEMVRTILDGRKTQTRRVVKQKHIPFVENILNGFLDGKWNQRQLPYGKPGDLLWVRETWLEMDRGGWCDPSKPKWWFDDCYNRVNAIAYRADCDAEGERIRREYGYKWRSPILMPRWASRITLRVTDVRVERVQDISEANAMAEGAERGGSTPRHAFIALWDSINAKRGYSWDSDPWVWVIEFEKVQQ